MAHGSLGIRLIIFSPAFGRQANKILLINYYQKIKRITYLTGSKLHQTELLMWLRAFCEWHSKDQPTVGFCRTTPTIRTHRWRYIPISAGDWQTALFVFQSRFSTSETDPLLTEKGQTMSGRCSSWHDSTIRYDTIRWSKDRLHIHAIIIAMAN